MYLPKQVGTCFPNVWAKLTKKLPKVLIHLRHHPIYIIFITAYTLLINKKKTNNFEGGARWCVPSIISVRHNWKHQHLYPNIGNTVQRCRINWTNLIISSLFAHNVRVVKQQITHLWRSDFLQGNQYAAMNANTIRKTQLYSCPTY